jgi:DNA-directed RNA polymerase specialized sigma subunit
MINNTTCFDAHKKCNKSCINNSCKYWQKMDSYNNCIINAANSKEEFTLQEIGDIFNITRMRICQIEKQILDKLKNNSNLFQD